MFSIICARSTCFSPVLAGDRQRKALSGPPGGRAAGRHGRLLTQTLRKQTPNRKEKRNDAVLSLIPLLA
jgi:hypothetical protein